MRVAILSVLEDLGDALSIKRVVVDQVAQFQAAGHSVIVYVKQGFHATHGTLPCIADVKLPGWMDGDHARVAREFVERFGHGELASYDAIICHDLYFLDRHMGYRQGIREMHDRVKAKWFHWSHSVPRPQRDAKGILGHVYIALNHEDVVGVAQMYDVPRESVEVCYNPADITDVLSSDTAALVNAHDLLNADFLGVLPFPIGRLNQKGVDRAVGYYTGIARRGHRVKVVLCASRCDSGQKELQQWEAAFAKVTDGTTCEVIWAPRSQPAWMAVTPNRVVRELMGLSNLMLWPTIGEACSLAIAEARASGGPFLVLPESRVHGMREMADEDTYLCYWQKGHWREKEFREPQDVADEILRECDLERFQRRLRRQWEWSRRGLWERHLKPLLERRCPGDW